jgi:hypothetical protein
MIANYAGITYESTNIEVFSQYRCQNAGSVGKGYLFA